MMRLIYEKRTWAIACFGLLVLALAMAGCNGNGEVAAQAVTEWRTLSFDIEPNSFELRTTLANKPGIVVSGEVTRYTISAGGANFNYVLKGADNSVIGIQNPPVVLLANDEILERPSVTVSAGSTITLIRQIQ
jgi:hypothetical protein